MNTVDTFFAIAGCIAGVGVIWLAYVLVDAFRTQLGKAKDYTDE